MYLGKHFTLEELTVSQEAVRRRLDNTPGPDEVLRLRALVANVLDPLRDALGRPVVVSSGYRSPAVNVKVGGVATSQHCKGEAADIIVPGMSAKALCREIIRLDLPFDQLIQEFGRWAHVSHRLNGRQRGDILTARHNAQGRAEYLGGLV